MSALFDDRRVRSLISQLTRYDLARRRLQTSAWSAENVDELTDLLSAPVAGSLSLQHGRDLARRVRLIGPRVAPLCLAVSRIGRLELPAFHLTRVGRFDGAAVVVERLYSSHDYPVGLDRRLCRVALHGRRVHAVDLSEVRRRAAGIRGSDGLDEYLLRAGGGVLSRAFSPHQAVGLAVAAGVDLPRFQEALELVYLLASPLDPIIRLLEVHSELPAFFDRHGPMPHASLQRALEGIVSLEASARDHVRAGAREATRDLQGAFSEFVSTILPGGRAATRRTGLLSFTIANLDRLKRALPHLQPAARRTLTAAAEQLTRTSARVILDQLSAIESQK